MLGTPGAQCAHSAGHRACLSEELYYGQVYGVVEYKHYADFEDQIADKMFWKFCRCPGRVNLVKAIFWCFPVPAGLTFLGH